MSITKLSPRAGAPETDQREMAVVDAADLIQREVVGLWSLLEVLEADEGLAALGNALRISDEGLPNATALANALRDLSETLATAPFHLVDRLEQEASRIADLSAAVRWYGARTNDLALRLEGGA